MRFPLLIVIIFLAVNALVDTYLYCAIHSITKHKFWHRLQKWSAILFAVALIVAICLPKRGGSDDELRAVMWILYSYISIYASKYVFLIFDVMARIPLLWKGSRWRWMIGIGIGAGALTFLAFWWGALYNRYQIDVVEQTIEIPHLPQGFNGLKIAQISDLHVGTFRNDTSFYSALVDEVNALHPDIIVFTGDIVNRCSNELRPFMPVFSRLHAPLGVYSVMGNHDYGDYKDWRTDNAQAQDIANLKAMQAEMGWKMLNNSTQWLRAGRDSLAIIGVENVGDPPFKTYGDLKKAYPDISDSKIKILLTHNPAHWTQAIKDHEKCNIALTLSGHTHAMQIELLGLSPAAFRYDTWGGLYSDDKEQQLYVNIGAGEVGFPARIGATPEITLITLKKAL